MKTVAKGINPVNQDIYFSLRYQGFCPIIDGTTFTLHGNLMLFFLIPKNDPINTRGVDMHIQRTTKTANSDIVNPSLDCSNEKVTLTMKRTIIEIPGKSIVVSRLHLSQSLPPLIL